MRAQARTLAAAALVLTAAGCSAKKDPIEALLADLEQAAEKRDSAAIERHLAADFMGEGSTKRADVGPLLRRYFAGYERVSLEVYDVAIERQEETARLGFRVDFDGRPLQVGGLAGFLPPSAMFRFDLGLRIEDHEWRIASAAWEELSEAQGSP